MFIQRINKPYNWKEVWWGVLRRDRSFFLIGGDSGISFIGSAVEGF